MKNKSGYCKRHLRHFQGSIWNAEDRSGLTETSSIFHSNNRNIINFKKIIADKVIQQSNIDGSTIINGWWRLLTFNRCEFGCINVFFCQVAIWQSDNEKCRTDDYKVKFPPKIPLKADDLSRCCKRISFSYQLFIKLSFQIWIMEPFNSGSTTHITVQFLFTTFSDSVSSTHPSLSGNCRLGKNGLSNILSFECLPIFEVYEFT